MIDDYSVSSAGFAGVQSLAPNVPRQVANDASTVPFSSVMQEMSVSLEDAPEVKNTLESIGYIHDSTGYHTVDGMGVLGSDFDGSQEAIDYVAGIQSRHAMERAVQETASLAWHRAYPEGTAGMKQLQDEAKTNSDRMVAQWNAAGFTSSFAMVGTFNAGASATPIESSLLASRDFSGVQSVQQGADTSLETAFAGVQNIRNSPPTLDASGTTGNLVDQLLEQMLQSSKG